jgi:hypothetical protein
MGKRISAVFRSCYQLASVFDDHSGVARMRIFFTLLCVPLLKRLNGRRPMPIRVIFCGTPRTLYVRDGADIAVMCEVFAEDEYATRLDQTPRSIVDIGGHARVLDPHRVCVPPSTEVSKIGDLLTCSVCRTKGMVTMVAPLA